jgi:hypothetical protein
MRYLLQITETHVMDTCSIFYSTKTDKQGTYFDISKNQNKKKLTENKPYDIIQRNRQKIHIAYL